MAGDGTITRKDIITDDSLTWGPEYAKQIQIAIGANKEFASGLKEINTLASAFRKASGQDEFIALKQKQALANQKVLDSTKQLEAAEISAEKIKQAKIKTDKDALALSDKEASSKKRNTKLTIEERIQNEINNRTLKQEALDRLGLLGAYAKLNKARTEAKRTLLDLLAAENQDIKAIKEATKAFEALDKRVRAADHAVGDFTKNVGNYPKLTGFTNGIRDLVGAFGIVGGIQAFGSILKGAYDINKQFEQSLADLRAITGATGKDLDFLRKNAIELGKSTKGGAIAVVESYKLIAGAKPELLENVKDLNAVTEAVITLSQASGLELPDAATRLTDAMNQFNAPASEAARFIDALANGAKFGAAEIPDITDALLKFGAVARSTNVSVEQSTALVELLAENGLKGAEAGTALRNVLLKLSAPDALPKAAQLALKGLGISFDELKDKSKPIEERFELLKPLLADNGKLVKVFGVENVVAAQNIISHTDRLKDLSKEMKNYGTAQEQADIITDTLQGDTDKLVSTYDSLILSMQTGQGPVTNFFRAFVQGLKNTLDFTALLFKDEQQLTDYFVDLGKGKGLKEFQAIMRNIAGTSKENIEATKQEILARERENIRVNQAIVEAEKKKRASIIGGDRALFHLQTKQEEDALVQIGKSAEKIKQIKNTYLTPKATPNTPAAAATGTGVDEKAEKDRLKALKALSDAEFALQKEKLERYIKINQEITDNELLGDNIRIVSAQNVQETEAQLIELTKQNKLDYDKFVKDSDKLNADQKALIDLQAYNESIDSAKKLQKQLEKIRVFDEESYKKSLTKKLSDNQIAENDALQAENERFKALGNVEELANKEREKAIEEHERNVFEIKKKYAIEALKLQISNLQSELDASDALPEGERLTAEKRQEIAEKLSKAKLDLSAAEVETNKKKNQIDIMNEKEKAMVFLQISADLTGALNDLASALFETKIQNIETEIEKNNEYYDKQIEAAGDNEKQIDLLEKERDKKNKALDEKKKKEQRKQAVANKAAALAQATISAALAVLAALNTQPFLPLGPAMAILAGVLGGIQIAAIAATPIPKYKMGRRGGKAEKAIVGDGGVSEVIERRNGKIELTPAKDTLVELASGDNVYKSIEDYKKNGRISVMNSLGLEQKKVNEYFNITLDRDKYGKEIVTELKEVVKSVRKIKLKSTQQKPVDLNHELWKYKNIKS